MSWARSTARAAGAVPRLAARPPGDRALYERTKRELARRDWKYGQQYADAKTEIVEQILARGLADTAHTE